MEQEPFTQIYQLWMFCHICFISVHVTRKILKVAQRNISYNIKGKSTSQLEPLQMKIVDSMRWNIVDDFLIPFIILMFAPQTKTQRENSFKKLKIAKLQYKCCQPSLSIQ